ncbi:hypothetical protein B296_00046120 [Ensete ventricosum]|uniref:Uncharacterized protein n=1 Tax=Ensete ventricosum TaxID=4639 RepID=A0A426YL24_ENSVE|nr:hypothetical protein B296_00046120 [Ensete ventricosum]
MAVQTTWSRARKWQRTLPGVNLEHLEDGQLPFSGAATARPHPRPVLPHQVYDTPPMPKLGRIWNSPPGRVKLRVLEKDKECFIPVGGEPVSTPSLTFVVPQDMVEMYGGHAAAAAWGEGMV